jgi:hypothetical protein
MGSHPFSCSEVLKAYRGNNKANFQRAFVVTAAQKSQPSLIYVASFHPGDQAYNCTRCMFFAADY